MNLVKISWSNIAAKPLNTALSVVLLSFGVGIISLLLLLEKQVTEKFDRNIKDIDFVLGAKGSPMQLILANVYHVDAPTGNIKVSDAQKVLKNPMVKEAIPLAYGDNYEKWRIVGTNFKYPEHYGYQMKEGRLFSAPFEATLGARVAQETGLKVGDTFTSMHGFDNQSNEEDAHHHDHPFRVVGIMENNNSALDNLILTPVESVWLVHDHGDHEGEAHDEHAHEDHDHAHDDHAHDDHDHAHDEEASQEMTAYLIKKRNPLAAMMLANVVRDTNMQLADPAIEMNRLSQNFGLGMDTIRAIAILIMILSFVSVFISLYNSLKERKYELALLRSMGGSRSTLFRLIMQEGLLLVVIGFALGMILSRVGLFVLSSFLKENFQYELNDVGISTGEIVLFGVTLFVGMMASLLPAVRAVKMDISKTLANA
ncbi:MAG: ABC transporter permease [Flavobacteriales bacterium]|jgi:putative ABC transport system permease protein